MSDLAECLVYVCSPGHVLLKVSFFGLISYYLCSCRMFSLWFTEQEDSSALHSLDLMFNDIQTDGAQVLAKSLQVHIYLSYTLFIGILSVHFYSSSTNPKKRPNHWGLFSVAD